MTRALLLALAAGALGTLAPRAARAEDTSKLPPRIGVLPTIGLGVAKLSNSSPFPGFIGLTTFGGEIHAEVPPYGGFLRFQFHSSGLDGRWTAPSFGVGGSYRLFGDGVESVGLLARGGLLWERWHATSGNCPIDFFFPTNCKALEPQAPTGVILNQAPIVNQTADTIGLFAGVRAEMPISFLYLAFDGELAGTGDVSQTVPGTVLSFRVAASLGFRDLRRRKPETVRPTPRENKKY